jgi:hypothetical protein
MLDFTALSTDYVDGIKKVAGDCYGFETSPAKVVQRVH